MKYKCEILTRSELKDLQNEKIKIIEVKLIQNYGTDDVIHVAVLYKEL